MRDRLAALCRCRERARRPAFPRSPCVRKGLRRSRPHAFRDPRRSARTPSCSRRSASEVRAVLESERRSRPSPSSRSAAGPVWWAESSRFATASTADRARPVADDRGLDRRSLPDRHPRRRSSRAGGRSSARRVGIHPRALSSVVRVRDGGGLGRHAVRGPGFDGLRQDRGHGRRSHLHHTGGGARIPALTGERGRAAAPGARGRLGRCARSDNGGDSANSLPAGRAPLRGMDVQRLQRRGGGFPPARAGGRRA